MADLIRAYAERLRAAGCSEQTIKTRSRALRHAHKTLPSGLNEACGDEITAYLATKIRPWTRSTYYYALKSYYSRLVRARKLSYDPMETVDRPKSGDSLPNPVSDEELAYALDHSPHQPWRAAIILGAYAGLRCSELCAITGDDVSRERVLVREGKGGKSRTIPTHPLVWALREEMGAGHLVLDHHGQPTTMPRLSCNQGRHWRRIGLPPTVHLHRFRHWFATALVEQGVGPDVVQGLMGHSSIATTMNYVRVSAARKSAAIRVLPTFVPVAPEPDASRLGHTAEAA